MRFQCQVIFGLLLTLSISSVLSVIKCPLTWVQLGAGEEIPETAIPVQLFTIHFKDVQIIPFIIKALPTPSSTLKRIGVYLNGQAYIPDDSGYFLKSPGFFQILTNPNSCSLEWRDSKEVDTNKYPVPIEKDAAVGYVGRAFVLEDLKFLPGSVDVIFNAIVVPSISNDESVRQFNAQVLHSHSPGLFLKMKKFRVTNQEVGIPQKMVLGFDQIINESPAIVRQSVRHASTVTEDLTIVTSKSWKSIASVEFRAYAEIQADMNIEGLLGPSNNESLIEIPRNYSTTLNPHFEFGKTWSSGSDSEDTISQQTEARVGLNKEVEVPAYSSIQVCSSVTTQSFTLEYEADGEYTGPGLSPQEIQEILQRSGRSGFRTKGSKVTTTESGSFTGNVVINTNFFVMNVDDEVGCHTVV